MRDDLRGIGAVARESGLPVSALRFYDAAGVLPPAWTDPVTGYRWYSTDQVDQARLVAGLRQVEMPLADIAQVLANRHRPAEAAAVLERHDRVLETRLAEARERLSEARRLVVDPPVTRFEVTAADLARALDAVRYAVGSDPTWPALTGILLDCSDGALRLVACDRVRLAVVSVPARGLTGPPVRFVAPLPVLDALPRVAPPARAHGAPLPGGAAPSAGAGDDPVLLVELRLDRIVLHGPGTGSIVAEPVAAAYPDYRSLLHASWVREACVPASALVDRVVNGSQGRPVVREAPDVVAVLLREREVDVVSPGMPGAVPFDRTYLLEALAALGEDDVLVALDAARQVLAMAPPARPDDKNLLMPVRLHR